MPSPPYVKLSLGNFGFLAGRLFGSSAGLLMAQIDQNHPFWGWKLGFGPKIQFLETSSKKLLHYHAEQQQNILFVLTMIALNGGLLGSHQDLNWAIFGPKIEVYGCSVKNMKLSGQKMGPKPAQEPPLQSFQQQKVHIYLILTTFVVEITLKPITQWLSADLEETHFFLGRPVICLGTII